MKLDKDDLKDAAVNVPKAPQTLIEAGQEEVKQVKKKKVLDFSSLKTVAQQN